MIGGYIKVQITKPDLVTFGPYHFVLSELEILFKMLSYDFKILIFFRHDIHHPVRTLSQALSQLKLSTYSNRGQS